MTDLNYRIAVEKWCGGCRYFDFNYAEAGPWWCSLPQRGRPHPDDTAAYGYRKVLPECVCDLFEPEKGRFMPGHVHGEELPKEQSDDGRDQS